MVKTKDKIVISLDKIIADGSTIKKSIDSKGKEISKNKSTKPKNI